MSETQENYNETVLIPILQKRVNALTTDTILLEAKLEIANKEKAKLEELVKDMQDEAQVLNARMTDIQNSNRNSTNTEI